MGFFAGFRQQPRQPKVEGLLGYYGLGEWWLSTFTSTERERIEAAYQPMSDRPGSHPLTQGRVKSTSQTAIDFLSGLASWFRKVADASISQRIRAKMDELAQARPVTGAGFYRGRHYTTYVEDLKALKRSGDTQAAERLLLGLVNAVEAESRAKGWPVAPWYYDELAKIYRACKDYAAEIAILERCIGQMQGKRVAVVASSGVLERLEKARMLLAKSQGE